MESHDITRLLGRVSGGDVKAADELLPLIYDQLRAVARSYFRDNEADQTLQPTALVHEAYLRLVNVPDDHWKDRVHFSAVAATAMRQILTDRARRRRAAKRGGDAQRYAFENIETPFRDTFIDVIALDEVLSKLSALSERRARIVEFRVFGGMTFEEMGHVLEISKTMVQKDWRFARAWLIQELQTGENP